VVEKLARLKRTRLITALDDVDPGAFAEEDLHTGLAMWPRY